MENPKLCSECGGACCKAMPGACFPVDFGRDEDLVAEALASGRYCVDWWENFEDGHAGYYVRPAIKGMEGVLFDPAWGGACTFLANDGCALAPPDRPWTCMAMVPAPSEECRLGQPFAQKYDAAVAWWEWKEFFRGLKEGE